MPPSPFDRRAAPGGCKPAAWNCWARRSDFLAGLPLRIDSLIDSTNQGEWQKVRRLAEFLAVGAQMFQVPVVAGAAEAIALAASECSPELAVKRGLMRLIAASATATDSSPFDTPRRAG